MNPTRFVSVLFDRITREESSKGRQHELKAVAAFQGRFYDVPDWFLDIENASARLDRAGADVVVWSDIGRLLIQIKSCEAKAEAFRQEQEDGGRRKDISVVVIKEHFTPYEVRQAILFGARSEYRRILTERATKQGATFISAEAA